jgi:hypothetical protein
VLKWAHILVTGKICIKGCPRVQYLALSFLNDIFYFIKNSDFYNYADDNTLSYSDHDINEVISTLEDDSMTLINWFSINKMKASPEKVQAIAIGKQTKQQNLTFTLDGNKIECESEVKLLW